MSSARRGATNLYCKPMNKNLHTRLAQLTAVAALACTPLFLPAQETVVTTTGTISSVSPSEVVVARAAGGPVAYRYTKRTTFVDAAGRTISYDTIRPGDSTTVYYTMVDGQPVVGKVLVTRKTTTTTTTEPTVTTPVVEEETTTTTTTTTPRK